MTSIRKKIRKRIKNKKTEFNDLGFGTKIQNAKSRFINKDGSLNVHRVGISEWTPYQSLVEMSWTSFFSLSILSYVLINVFFALIFMTLGVEEELTGIIKKDFFSKFAHAFFFSVQTFTTVGYGTISPNGFLANMVASVDALFGLLSLALITGIFFARFSKPKAQILFSEKAVICDFKDGLKGFMFRIANKRNNKIIDLEVFVTMTWIEGSAERKFRQLKLERNKLLLFPLNWTIVHPIEDKSPLYEKTKEEILTMKPEFIIQLKGYDDSFSSQIHMNSSYIAEEILWDKKFDTMYQEINGRTVLELDKINNVKSWPV